MKDSQETVMYWALKLRGKEWACVCVCLCELGCLEIVSLQRVSMSQLSFWEKNPLIAQEKQGFLLDFLLG